MAECYPAASLSVGIFIFQQAHHSHVLVLRVFTRLIYANPKTASEGIEVLFLSVLPAEKTGPIVLLSANTKHPLFRSVT